MKLKTTTVLNDFAGKPIVDEDKKPVTLRSVLITALNSREENITAEQSMRAYILGTEVMTKDEVELKAEDVVYLKARLLKLFPPVVYGQVVQMLEKE